MEQATATLPPSDRSAAGRVLILRHSLAVRIMHWVNFITLTVMLMSGLQIFNAHPALYWGRTSHFSRPVLSMGAMEDDQGHSWGVTTVGSHTFVTTGVLGWSKGSDGTYVVRGFPTWATLPGPQWLAMGRAWHFFFAWILVVNGAAYVILGILSGHIRRDLWLTRVDWRRLWHTFIEHARLRFPKGDEARRYNGIQKLAYLFIIFIVAPLIVLTGLTMSPTMDAGWPWLLRVFDGRQSARTIHFICATTLLGFFLVHIAMVILSGLWNNLRSMITGRYAIETSPAAGRDHHE
ncbi:MAG TPA: cytochrome b/b6 domain-containing protein [Steroidobacteraceae bacterium]|nr:cytochrome b/b6 domain-containing protein [Steroidobacteraceae bacterium]